MACRRAGYAVGNQEGVIVNEVIDMVGRADGIQLAGIVAVMVLAESLIVTDLLVPGELGLVVAGAAAATNGTSIAVIIVAAALGAVAGDTIGYGVGRRWGDDVVGRWRFTRRLRPALARARRHLEHRGGVIVAAARWVGALRAVVPVVAGTAMMPLRRFIAYDAPSAVAWATAVVCVGYAWGDDVADAVDRIGLGVSVAAVVVIVVAVWVVRRRATPSAAAEKS